MALIETVYAPQWGRLSSSRITLQRRPDSGDDLPAAMGPALIEPDHRRPGGCTPATGTRRNGAGSHRAGSRAPSTPPQTQHSRPQWGRLSSSRITDPNCTRRWRPGCRNGAGSHRAGSPVAAVPAAKGRSLPQWGRLSSSRITCRTTRRRCPACRCRNGAGSHRAGSPVCSSPVSPRTTLPQWGRLSSSRITRWSHAATGGCEVAAMGPALIEPDHVIPTARPSPS